MAKKGWERKEPTMIRCSKCGHEAEFHNQLPQEYARGEWFISADDLAWDYEHACDWQ